MKSLSQMLKEINPKCLEDIDNYQGVIDYALLKDFIRMKAVAVDLSQACEVKLYGDDRRQDEINAAIDRARRFLNGETP